MLPRLNIDVKERICQIAHAHQLNVQDAGVLSDLRQIQFANLTFTLTHVDSQWRRVAMRYAWHTVYVDDCLPNDIFHSIHTVYARYTRKLCVMVRFRGIVSHYRRYSMTHENADLQPFCHLHMWPQLEELDITYAHKCGFPGLASYIEPRLCNVRKLTVRGRLPIDMRRAVLFLNSPKLKEMHVRAFLRDDDSLSTISNYGDPILLMPIASSLSTITLTTAIDVRIIRAVLDRGRQQLKKVALIGLCPAQLVATGVTRAFTDLVEKRERVWSSLKMLNIKICMHLLGNAPAKVYLNATEFPSLECLKITDCSSAISVSDHPLSVVYGQSFSKTWLRLRYLYIMALSDHDSMLVSQYMPYLAKLDVQSMQILKPECLMTALGLWHLLTSALPLSAIRLTCLGQETPEDSAENVSDEQSLLDFDAVRTNHPARVLVVPNIRLTQLQIESIRQRCKCLSSLAVASSDYSVDCVPSSCSKACQEPPPLLIQSMTYLASTTPPYRRMVRIMNLWGGN
ncbi:hypothetical protein GGI25_000095 [Coemansia spiralis]|uniref:Uncharacterized protein n=2 Tax=Coemansia TaxID=4863 RepID=A0A9W8G853_9FUNG|nr:hypothetical protein EDC05_002740 [Coemansia umbellata]KAJ2620284.1 hypothetical protein GGI26_005108 [Coemansia sp. RSA 1358]KAJ2681140.1 hypothetical protein GGI25_000095 [Coemansia spiralis]